MHSVSVEPLGERHAVVDDEGNIGVGADALQRLGQAGKLVLGDILHAELESRRDARLKRGLEAIGKGPANILRADQIQLRWLRPVRRRKGQRIEFKIVRHCEERMRRGNPVAQAWIASLSSQ